MLSLCSMLHVSINDQIDYFFFTFQSKNHVCEYSGCGHCKKAKPEMVNLAESFKDDSRTVIGAVDCTRESSLCQEHEVSGYPTIKYYSFYDKVNLNYNGGRTVSFRLFNIYDFIDMCALKFLNFRFRKKIWLHF